MACHQRLGTALTEEGRRAWHDIITYGKHTWLNYVGRGMPSSPMGSTNGRTMSGATCHHRLWKAHTVERRRVWHSIIAFGQHKRSNDVGRGMSSSPFGSTHGRTTLGVACHNRLKATHTVERHWAWHDITAFGQHTRSNVISVACHHRRLVAHTVEQRWPWHDITAL